MENPVEENHLDSSTTETTQERTLENYVAVPEFYNGRSIFITGGTGFMGKVSLDWDIFVGSKFRGFFIEIFPIF